MPARDSHFRPTAVATARMRVHRRPQSEALLKLPFCYLHGRVVEVVRCRLRIGRRSERGDGSDCRGSSKAVVRFRAVYALALGSKQHVALMVASLRERSGLRARRVGLPSKAEPRRACARCANRDEPRHLAATDVEQTRCVCLQLPDLRSAHPAAPAEALKHEASSMARRRRSRRQGAASLHRDMKGRSVNTQSFNTPSV